MPPSVSTTTERSAGCSCGRAHAVATKRSKTTRSTAIASRSLATRVLARTRALQHCFKWNYFFARDPTRQSFIELIDCKRLPIRKHGHRFHSDMLHVEIQRHCRNASRASGWSSSCTGATDSQLQRTRRRRRCRLCRLRDPWRVPSRAARSPHPRVPQRPCHAPRGSRGGVLRDASDRENGRARS